MIRSFVLTLVTIAAVSAALSAQPAPKPIPVAVSGGTPGVTLEFYLNAGKLADATVNATGGADWVLDLSNLGKTRVDIYVDVCKDGKVVKVLFVTGSGQAPPEDEGCNRRLAAVSFQSDCGATQINFDFRNFGARVLGCATAIYRRPPFIAGVAAAAVAVPFLLGGGDDSSTVGTTPQTPQQPTGVTPTVPTSPPTNTTIPNPPAPVAPVNLTGGFPIVFVVHGSNTSRICGIVQASQPPPGTTFAISAIGPAVLPNQSITGTFNSNSQSAFSVSIGQFGNYTLTMTMTAPNNGGSGTASTSVNVTSSGQSQCPTVPS